MMERECDEVARKIIQAAEELGIDIIDIRTPDEEAEILQHCNLPVDLKSKGKIRRLIRERQQPAVFVVQLRVCGALRSRGARGNVYKALETHQGWFSSSEGKVVIYEHDDLVVQAYFLDMEKALSFQTSMNQWEIYKYLVLIDQVLIKPHNPQEVGKPKDQSEEMSTSTEIVPLQRRKITIIGLSQLRC
jgi:hypothetical protein